MADNAQQPTTRLHVSGYRFLVRRMEHALVRGDTRMLDDPQRAQSLSFAAGGLLAHFGLQAIGNIGVNLSVLPATGMTLPFISYGGTALLTQSYRPAEQLRVQAVNEFSIFGLVALATLSAGWVYDRFGWVALNLAVVPLLVVALLTAVGIERRMRAAV